MYLAIKYDENLILTIAVMLICAAVIITIHVVFWIWKVSQNTEKTVQLLVEENKKLEIIIHKLENNTEQPPQITADTTHKKG